MDYADIRKHQHHLQDIKIGIERKIYASLQFQQEKSEFSLQKKAVSQCETAAIFCIVFLFKIFILIFGEIILFAKHKLNDYRKCCHQHNYNDDIFQFFF